MTLLLLLFWKVQEVLLLCAKTHALIFSIHLLECPITLDMVMFSVQLLFVFLITLLVLLEK